MQNFLRDLQASADELSRAGFAAEAAELRDLLAAAWTSSSEMAGELGLAIVRIEAMHGAALPKAVRLLFRSALVEIHSVWPAIGAEPGAAGDLEL